MIWADMRDLCARRLQRRHAHALLIHIGTGTAHTLMLVDLLQLAVARCLDTVDMIASEQLDEQAVEILCARTHNNLRGIHRHAAK